MSLLISILILIASLLLIGVVLIQKSKGGGLASNFSSSNQIMGVRKTTDFVEKATWTLALVIVVLSIVSVFVNRSTQTENQVITGTEQVEQQSYPTQSEEAAAPAADTKAADTKAAPAPAAEKPAAAPAEKPAAAPAK